MTEGVQNLLALNIVLFGAVAIGLALMVFWSRATTGVWPDRRKVILLSGVNLFIWVSANILYFYFRAH
jgi:hypothetical protein